MLRTILRSIARPLAAEFVAAVRPMLREAFEEETARVVAILQDGAADIVAPVAKQLDRGGAHRAGSQGVPVMVRIRLADAARRYRQEPHQLAAWNRLEELLTVEELQEFAELYGAAVAEKPSPYVSVLPED